MSWRSKKQSSVALSTVKAKYVALASSAQEVIWMRLVISLICAICVNCVCATLSVFTCLCLLVHASSSF